MLCTSGLLWPARKERWRILLVGDQEVGRTSFAYRFADDVYRERYEKLVFEEDHVKELVAGENDECTVYLSDRWVIQTDYRDIEEDTPYADGYLLLYSIASRTSLQEISRLCRKVPRFNLTSNPDVVLVLVGTKSDLGSSREVSSSEGEALAREIGCHTFIEVSAKEGTNIDQAVLVMVQALRESRNDRQGLVLSVVNSVKEWVGGLSPSSGTETGTGKAPTG